MQMSHGPNGGRGRHSAVHMGIDREQMVLGKPIFPSDRYSFAGASFDCGPGVSAFVSPQSRWRKLRVEFGFEFKHTNLIMSTFGFLDRSQRGKNWQRIDVAIDFRAVDDRQRRPRVINLVLLPTQ